MKTALAQCLVFAGIWSSYVLAGLISIANNTNMLFLFLILKSFPHNYEQLQWNTTWATEKIVTIPLYIRYYLFMNFIVLHFKNNFSDCRTIGTELLMLLCRHEN